MKSRQARADLAQTLQIDLVGPDNGHAFETELLPETPTGWYLTGYLVPANADNDLRVGDEGEGADIDEAPAAGGFDDDAPVDRSASGNNYLPSSMGLTTIVTTATQVVKVRVEWGDYIEEKYEKPGKEGATKTEYCYRRSPRSSTVEVRLADLEGVMQTLLDVPNSRLRPEDPRGLMLSCIARPVPHLSTDCKALTVFLVNYRAVDDQHSYRSCAFQAKFSIDCARGFVGRPDMRGTAASHLADPDNSIADLHYRDVLEYAVGHGTSVDYVPPTEGAVVQTVFTTWMPKYEVERVIPSSIETVEFRMFTLGAFESGSTLADHLLPLVADYRERMVSAGSTPGYAQSCSAAFYLWHAFFGQETFSSRDKMGSYGFEHDHPQELTPESGMPQGLCRPATDTPAVAPAPPSTTASPPQATMPPKPTREYRLMVVHAGYGEFDVDCLWCGWGTYGERGETRPEKCPQCGATTAGGGLPPTA